MLKRRLLTGSVSLLAFLSLSVGVVVAAPSFGSGVVISSKGDILTAAHVVENCRTISVKAPGDGARKADLIANDKQNDLALIRSRTPTPTYAILRAGNPPKPGENVIVIGYPLAGLLSSDPITTTGVLSAVSGLQDDVRYYQLTAPVQPGNSGGPLLDGSGHVIGLVAAKLDFRIAAVTGALPENANFAVKSEMIRLFLASHGISMQEAVSVREQAAAAIVSAARSFTTQIICDGPPNRTVVKSAPTAKAANRQSSDHTNIKDSIDPNWLKH